jgi:DNA helicase-4
VKYKTGIFSSLFKNVWSISTENDAFVCKKPKAYHRIDYFNIRGIRIEEGLIWDTVTVTTSDQSFHLKGLSAKVARSLSQDIETRTKDTIITHVLSAEGVLPEVHTQIKKLLNSNRYISQSDIRNCVSQVPDIGQDLAHPYFDPDLLPKKAKSNLEVFLEIRKPGSLVLKQVNEKFIQRAIGEFSQLFQQLEEFPLSEEQMRAAIINEDRNLLIAAAGSGKSSTVVAKAVYLVSAGLAKPEEILILAFNKDAQIEVEQRLVELIDVVPEYQTPLKVKTFHGFGYEVLSEVEEIRPSISEFSTGGRKTQTRLFTDLIRHLYENDPGFMTAWQEFLIVDKYPTPNLFKVKSQREYEEYLQELGARRKMLPEGMQMMITTIDGNEVRSFEEARIANWLALNGVEYEYERQYVNPKNPEESINYNPDFYYPQADIYHEHFAVNSEGKTPPFIGDNYLAEMDWKKKTHRENGTKLIETHSAHFLDGTVFDLLKRELHENEVPFSPLEKSEANRLVREAFNPDVDCHVFISFLHHFKSNNATVELLKEKAKNLPDQGRVSLFLKIFEAIYKEHSKRLTQKDEIDFEDQINKACEYLETKRYRHPFKFILVDEFQDTSQDSKRMIQALLDQNESIKLFAVGDDWQSIYRFAGADIEIMTHFSNHFGATSQNYLTQTYRSFQGIVDVAATFVQRNEDQLKKNVSAARDIKKDQVILYGYENDEDQTKQVQELLKKLNALPNNGKLSVFLLARYSHLKPKKLGRHSNLDIKFSTIHASKGLQADYVILLNAETGLYGFPSTISDDPIMELVIPMPESYPHAEERRLMYVAITRAKKGVFIFSNRRKISPFVTELAKINRVKTVSLIAERLNPCPECDTGEIAKRVGQFGAFYGCSNYPDCEFTSPVECPKCRSGKLVKRESKHGPFLSCSTFPKCKYSESLKCNKI